MFDDANNAGITSIITISNSKKEWPENLELLNKYSNLKIKLYMTCGIHPHSAKTFVPTDIPILKSYFANKDCIAVGECGLDYNRMFSPADVQKIVFEEHIKIAAELDKPLYIHERDAYEDMKTILTNAKKKYPNLKGFIHCFTGTKLALETYLELGFYIGITGWICDNRRNQSLVEAVKKLPLDKLLIETDAPWLVPKVYSKRNNTRWSKPDALLDVLDSLVIHTNYKKEDLISNSIANTKALFNI